MAKRNQLIRPIVYPNSSRAEYRTAAEIQRINIPAAQDGDYNETDEESESTKESS